jgi:predicted metal-binding membrane protein
MPRPGSETGRHRAADEIMTAGIFLAPLRHDRAVVVGSLVVVIALAWTYLLLGAGIPVEMMDMGGGQVMVMLPEWTLGYAAVVLVMWAAMMVAMMLPSAAPVTLLVARIGRKRAEAGAAAGAGTALFVLGYLVIWLGFATAATTLQFLFDEAGLLSKTMAFGNTVLAGGVLIAAGIYQWTPLKQACLRHCRSPLEFLMFHWRESPLGPLTAGMRHGVFCLGCCWMLMALLFVGGIMNLVWIGAIALLVLVEKTLPWGSRTSRLTGALLGAWGVVILLTAA